MSENPHGIGKKSSVEFGNPDHIRRYILPSVIEDMSEQPPEEIEGASYLEDVGYLYPSLPIPYHILKDHRYEDYRLSVIYALMSFGAQVKALQQSLPWSRDLLSEYSRLYHRYDTHGISVLFEAKPSYHWGLLRNLFLGHGLLYEEVSLLHLELKEGDISNLKPLEEILSPDERKWVEENNLGHLIVGENSAQKLLDYSMSVILGHGLDEDIGKTLQQVISDYESDVSYFYA